MPVFGQGIVPASGPIANELTYVTRRAFIPKMVVQIYQSSPVIAALLANSQTASGGVSSVSVPVQGQPFVNSQWSDYSGSFNQPATQQGAFLAEFNLKSIITPIPFLGMEGALQMDHAIIPLLEARMNDATNSMVDALAYSLYNNYTNNLQIIGLPGAVDDGTNLATYGNINRVSSPWWKGTYIAAASPVTSAGLTRKAMLQYIVTAQKYGSEMPNFAVCGLGTFLNLANDFIGAESYQIQPGTGFDSDGDRPRSAFRALDVAGVPVYCDPYCPEGTLYILNTNYLNLYVHDQASFAFTGFESLLSNYQLGYVGAVLTLCELVVTKPKSCVRVSGIGYTAI
jgi:hypothetical protein